MQTVILSFSGGIDSTMILLDSIQTNKKIKAITFDYGQTKTEIKHAAAIIKYLKNQGINVNHLILDINKIFPILEGVIIPNRNAIFICILWAHALKENEQTTIAIGATESDYNVFPDCRELFFNSIESSLNIANPEKRITIERPLIYIKKSEIIKRIMASKYKEVLKLTYSSYSDEPSDTLADKERKLAFLLAGIKDPAVKL